VLKQRALKKAHLRLTLSDTLHMALVPTVNTKEKETSGPAHASGATADGKERERFG